MPPRRSAELEGIGLSELGRRWALGDEEAARRVIDTEQDGCFVVIFTMDEADVRR